VRHGSVARELPQEVIDVKVFFRAKVGGEASFSGKTKTHLKIKEPKQMLQMFF
jgi:hypothetical protein